MRHNLIFYLIFNYFCIESDYYIDLIKTTDNILWNNVTFADGRITTLDCFTCPDLKGEIPSDIGNLTKLTQLILFSTELEDTIPSSIGSLSELTALYITDSEIDGTIPSSIGNLSNLTNLYINNSQITGTIPSGIGSLNDLTTLDLRGNNLTGIIPNSICNSSSS